MGASIWTKFGSLIQNNVQISGTWSKSKPEVEFQYGGRLFFFAKTEVVKSQPSIDIDIDIDITDIARRHRPRLCNMHSIAHGKNDASGGGCVHWSVTCPIWSTYVYLLITLFILGMLYAIAHWVELIYDLSAGQPILARSTGSDRPIGRRNLVCS